MQLLFFDTETTGFLQAWGRIIQFWAIYWFYDKEKEEFHTERIINQYINTDAEMSEWAFKVHGISKEKISIFKKMDHYIREFLAYINKADRVIGHNIDFDLWMLKMECEKCWVSFDRQKIKTVCTMKTQWVVDYYWAGKRPKLQELHTKIFNKGFEDAHDAMSDITATKDCFLELYKQGKIVLF